MFGTKQLSWKLVTYAAGALATVATRHLLVAAWARFEDEPPPDDPADRRTSLPVATTWAVATGVGVAVMRLIALRSASRAWEAATHEAPPGYSSDGP